MNKELNPEKITQYFSSRGKTPQEFLETEQDQWAVQQASDNFPWWEDQKPEYWQK